MWSLETIGWIGNVCLAICGVPAAYQAIRTGTTQGLNVPFLLLWTIGECFTFVYVSNLDSAPLIFNYALNILSCVILCIYKARDIYGNKNRDWKSD